MSDVPPPNDVWDVIIVGAGPAGLSAFHYLTASTALRVLIVESGPALCDRVRDGPTITEGVGGAGLYSDGKFSFFPASTQLWELSENRTALRDAFEWTLSLLKHRAPDSDKPLSPFPQSPPAVVSTVAGTAAAAPIAAPAATSAAAQSAPIAVHANGHVSSTKPPPPAAAFSVKEYPSVYMPLPDRLKLIADLAAEPKAAASRVLCGRQVVSQRFDPMKRLIAVTTRATPTHEANVKPSAVAVSSVSTFHARTVILASGRFGPIACDIGVLTPPKPALKADSEGAGGGMIPVVPNVFRRLEVGVRVDDQHSACFFDSFRMLDPKLIFAAAAAAAPPPAAAPAATALVADAKQPLADANSGSGQGVEWRTFCACRNGEVCLTRTAELWTYSGRADGAPTQRSNVGWNTRIIDAKLAASIVHASGDGTPFWHRFSRADGAFTLPLHQLWAEAESPDAKSGSTADPPRESVRTVLSRAFGSTLAAFIIRGLTSLAVSFPILRTSKTARLIGPTLEGVGWYHAHHSLQLLSPPPGARAVDSGGDEKSKSSAPNGVATAAASVLPIWLAGDVCGSFRGLTAALVSGRYCAAQCIQYLKSV